MFIRMNQIGTYKTQIKQLFRHFEYIFGVLSFKVVTRFFYFFYFVMFIEATLHSYQFRKLNSVIFFLFHLHLAHTGES